MAAPGTVAAGRASQRAPGRLLVSTLMALVRAHLVRAVVLRATCAMLNYAQPLLLHVVLSDMEARDVVGGGSSQSTPVAAVLLGLAVTGYWLCWESYWFLNTRLHNCLRSTLMHFTYRKGLYITTGSSTGYSGGSLQNLMVTDAMRPTAAYPFESVLRIAEGLASVVFAACQLCALLGLAAGLVGVSVVATFAPLSFFGGRALRKYVGRVQESRDVRGRLLFEFLSAMRVVKCFNLEALAESSVAQAREQELRWLRRRRMLLPVLLFVASSCGLLGVAAAFAWYAQVSARGALTAAQAFTALAWMNILNSGLVALPSSVVNLVETFVSLGRLEALFLAETGEAWLHRLDSDGPSQREQLASGEPRDGGRPRFQLLGCTVDWPRSSACEGRPSSAEADNKRVFGAGLSFEIPHGSLVLICGPIGSGKSTLLSVLAGTLPASAGSCEVSSGRCALVAQRAWLQNGTLLENVLFGQAEDPERLGRVLDACMLGDDLLALPDGLQTQVGEMGVQLSGGQKQRVSLARALYASDCDAVLLDDVLSALDAHVHRSVWEEAICNQLGGRTRVLATHRVQHCRDPRVDKILILGADGSQEFFGTYAELQDSGSLGLLGLSEAGGDAAPAALAAQGAAPSPEQPRKQAAGPSHGAASESRATGGIAWADFQVYANACGGLSVIALISLPLVLYYVAALLTNWQLSRWTDHSPPNRDSELAFLAGGASLDGLRAGGRAEPGARDGDSGARDLGLYLMLVGATSLLRLVFMLVVQLASVVSSRRLYAGLMSKLLRLELAFFESTPTGQILNRCLKDMAQIDDRMADVALSVAQAWLDAATAAVVLAATAPWSLLAVPPFCAGYARVMRIYRWPARDLKRLEAVARSPIMNHFSDSTRGAGTVRAYGHDLRFMRKNLELVDACARAFYTYWGVRSWNAMALEFLGSLLLIASVACIAARVARGSLAPGVVGLALSYAMAMPRQLMWISVQSAELETEFVAIERVAQYVRLAPEADLALSTDAGQASVVDADLVSAGAAQAGVANTGLAVRDAWLRYTASGPWVLRGLSFDLPRGCRAAFVGRTGCGKSSLLAAVVRLYPVEHGQIFVQGRDVGSTPLAALRHSVRVLLQDPVLFGGTIRSNLLCQPAARAAPAADGALWDALRLVGLDGLIRSFGGLDAGVEEAGGNLSQGQRQLLCLARALMEPVGPVGREVSSAARRPRLALCDEPTSNCDPATDATIHGVLLEGLPRDWTVAVVCHRLHRLRSFDRVVVFEAGQVTDVGSPEDVCLPAGEDT
uniref:Uncharacterized protein n=1 Tax=Alexandrium monilatum TaxID=311494 RepID=A0A7S4UU60_9DINO